ncbi:MAG TPA: trypsin-like serine protease, partial [Saprospiraceae bacterium]|nr:trypsin-like serine protease [Saprospiraceae bacterium]
MKGLLKILGTAIIGGLVVIGGQYLFTNKDKKIEEPITFQQDNSPIEAKAVRNYTEETESNLPDLKEAASKTVHAVVYIQTEFTRKSSVYDQYFSIDDFFGRRSPSVLKASGSGVIISSNGYIVTNNHVVQEADKITITLNDKRTYNAKVIGTNPETDLALLKIDEKNLEYVKFGNSDQLQVGDWVLAVGNPFNLTSTVTAGIISAKARNINILGSNSAIESFLQTDAVVNPGNSGGALVDTKGRLVGINAAIASRTGSYIGYSFAIPVSIVKKVVTDLKEFGSVQRAYIGITIKEVNAELAKKLKLDSIKGVYIGSVLEKGAAYNAGL